MLIPSGERPSPKGWRLGDIEIDTARAQLACRGVPVVVDRNSYRVLLHLVEHAGEDVRKEDLLRVGWPGRVVSENSLAKAIGKLRQALGDDKAALIQVVQGYGYRLTEAAEALASATPLAAGPSTASASVRKRSIPWGPAIFGMLILLLALLALSYALRPHIEARLAKTSTLRPNTGEDVVAVLPFRSLDRDDPLDLFADGIANHLREKVLSLPNVRSITRAESVAYANDPRDPAEIARDLGANLIVTGTLSMRGGNLAVQFNMTDTSGRIPALSRVFERPPSDQATLLDDLYTALLDGIAQRPGGYDPDGGGTRNPEAYRAFLGAATLFVGSRDINNQRRALVALEQALKLDPGYADAWFMLADILGGGGYWADSVDELVAGRKRAITAMNRGLAISSGNPHDYLVRSEMRLLYLYDWKGAWADIEAARRLTPKGESSALLVWKARYLASAGRIEEAIATDSRAAVLDPLSGAWRNQGWHYLSRRDTRNARAVLMLALTNQPESAHINFYLALCDIFDGQPSAALARLEHSSTLFRLVGTAIAEHEMGNRVASEVALKKLTDQFAIPDGYWIATVHAWRGESDEAFAWLQRGMHHGDNNVMYIPFDPLLENLRKDPRYDGLLRQLEIPEDPEFRAQEMAHR